MLGSDGRGDGGHREVVGAQRRDVPMPRGDRACGVARVIASTFLSIVIGDSLKRKFVTGRVILPFSIRNTPSRVRPVTRIVCGSSSRCTRSA